jgi:putative nucleotidyltransferase with HDIG domain
VAFKTRKSLLADVKPGMLLGADVVSARGKVMLAVNTILTESMIDRLACWGYNDLMIVDDDEKANLGVRSRRQAEKENFTVNYHKTVGLIRQAFESVIYLQEAPLTEMSGLADNSLLNLTSTPGVLIYLTALRNADNYTFQHSVNVAIICGTIGKWLGLDNKLLRKLILAGMMHDVGKMLIPATILNKPGKLLPNEMDIMRNHATFGCDILSKSGLKDEDILQAIRQHHERLDGSGYPKHVQSDEISQLARIIAIADVYDAMTSDRVYQQSLTPFRAIGELFEEMFGKLDAAICTVFLNSLRDYFIGSVVKLRDGRLAEVIFMDGVSSDKMTVKTMDGDYVVIDNHKNMEIVQMVSL